MMLHKSWKRELSLGTESRNFFLLFSSIQPSEAEASLPGNGAQRLTEPHHGSCVEVSPPHKGPVSPGARGRGRWGSPLTGPGERRTHRWARGMTGLLPKDAAPWARALELCSAN